MIYCLLHDFINKIDSLYNWILDLFMDTESETKHKKNTSILDQTPSIVPGHRK